MAALRYGIIGCGVIGPVHAQALAHLPNAQIVAVCDTDAARAAQLAAEYGAEVALTDYRQLLERRDIDAVCICVPHYLHAPLAIAAALAGKHVFCEKPMALDPVDMDAMIAAAEGAGVQLGLCFQHRFDPVMIQLKRLVEEGAFGQLLLGGAHCQCRRTADYYRSAAWRGTWAQEGGGVLINQAIHTIDLMLWLFGEAVSISGSYSTLALADDIEVEDTASGVVAFANGASGHLSATTAALLDWNTRLHLYGTAGSAVVGTGFPNEVDLFHCSDPSIQAQVEDECMPAVGKQCYGNSHLRALETFTDCVLADIPYPIDGREGRRAAELVLGLYRASRTGQVVPLPLCERVVG